MKKNFWKHLASLALTFVLMVCLLPQLAVEAEAASNTHGASGITVELNTMYCKYCDSSTVYCDSISFERVSLEGNTLTIRAKLTTEAHGNDAATSIAYDYINITCTTFDCNSTYTKRPMGSGNWTLTADSGKSYGSTVYVSRAAGHSITSGVSNNDNGTHTFTCSLCGDVTEDCQMSTANCVAPATCAICSYTDGYTDPDNHRWSNWTITDTTHSRTCANGCGTPDSGSHSGGKATCTAKAVCSVCNTAYGNLAPDNHNWSDWTITDTTHSRTCTNGCGTPDSGDHSGGTATCYEKAVCGVCNTAYGNTLTHSLSYSKDGANKLVESCQNNCGHQAIATLKENGSTYTGSAVTASMEYDADWQGSKPTTVTYEGDTINVGTVTAKITVEGKELTRSYSISPAELTVTAEGYDGSFDFNPHGITVTATDVQGNPVTVKYGTIEGIYNLDASPTVTDASEDTRTVYYKVEKANHNPVTGSETITVNPRYYIPYEISKAGLYNGKPHDVTLTLSYSGHTLVEGQDYTFAGWGDQEMIYPGTYTSSVTFHGNFQGTNPVSYRIDTNSLSNVSVSQKGTLTYNGQPQTPEVNASATRVDGLSPVSFSYTKSSNGTGYGGMPSFTNAGTYTVYYKASAQYHTSRVGSFKVVIAKQTVPVPTIGSKVYNGQTLTADITGTDLYTVTKNEGGTSAGEYDVVLTLKDATNYKWETTEDADLTLKFAITPADNSWEEEPSIEGWTCGETAATPNTGKAKYGEATVKYVGTANEGTGYESEQPPELAGQYKAIFTVGDESGSYNTLTREVPFTIARADLPADGGLSIAIPQMIYNGLVQNDIIVSSALPGVKAEHITIHCSAEPKNAGDYTFTISVAQSPNYEAAQLENDSWKFTIDKAQPVISWEKNEFTYNAAAQGEATVTLQGEETYTGTVTYRHKFANKSGDWTDGLPTDVEDYIVEAAVAESANYTAATAANDQISIKPLGITPTVQIDPVSFTYDGTSKEPDVKVLSGETEIAPHEYTLTYENTTQVGAATVTVKPMSGGNYTFTAASKTYLILPDVSALEDITTDNVTSADQAAIDEIQAAMEDVVITGADEAAQKQWNDLLDRCDDLEKKIQDTAEEVEALSEAIADLPAQPTTADLDAIDDVLDHYEQLEDNLTDAEKEALAEDIEKLEAQKAAITAVNDTVKEITDSTAKLDKDDLDFDDKETMEDLLEKIEDLEDSPYLTAAQEQALADAAETLEELMPEFAEAEKVEKQLNALPATADPDDENAIKAYKAAKKAYTDLGDDQAKVDPAAVKKLSNLKAELTDYEIIKYSRYRWYRGSDFGLTITANGHFDNFVGVKMDGKYIDSDHYTAKSGSTIVILKAKYLQKLKLGKHTVEICFGDGDFTGEADFTFRVSSEAVTPGTGDSGNILLWSGITLCSAMALAALVILKKRRAQK